MGIKCTLLATAAATFFGNSAFAQSAPEATQQAGGTVTAAQSKSEPANDKGFLEEIVVTAQRKSERLQDVPIAITAVSADRLAMTGAATASDISTLTPSLNVPATQAYFQPRIRGVGTLAFGPGIENPIATYVDGVYLALAQSSLLNFSDVARVEVLKGPQGTLFGRNATGGLIQIITKDPEPGLGGSFDVSYGNYDRIQANASLHGGSDKISGIVTGFYNYQGQGYGKNLLSGRDTNQLTREYGVRTKLVFNPDDRTEIKLAADYVNSAGNYPELRLAPGTNGLVSANPGGRPWDTNNDFPAQNRFSGGGVSLTVNEELDAVKVVSITAYRKSKYYYQIDYDYSPNPFATIDNLEHDHQFSQELHVESSAESPISWIIGGYYFKSYGDFDPSVVAFSGPLVLPAAPVTAVTTVGNQKSSSFAAFGQATFPVFDNVNITGGVRYTTEKRSVDATQTITLANVIDIPATSDDSKTFKKLTFRFSIDYKIDSGTLIYASFNRGFKSGGFNLLSPGDASYEPEVLDAYEAGIKTELFGRKLRINPAFFYYESRNIQLPFFTSAGQVGIANGPSATLYGGDVDVELVPIHELRIYGGASYIHNKFGNYPNAVIGIPIESGGFIQTTGDASGNNIPFTSKFSANVGGEYTLNLKSGEIAFAANYYHNSGYALEVDNRARQGAFNTVSASVTWTSEDQLMSLRLWGKNLTNEAIFTQFGTTPTGAAVSYQPPRTYGVTLSSKF